MDVDILTKCGTISIYLTRACCGPMTLQTVEARTTFSLSFQANLEFKSIDSLSQEIILKRHLFTVYLSALFLLALVLLLVLVCFQPESVIQAVCTPYG